MSDFLKKFKSVFIVEDEKSATPQQEPQTTPVEAPVKSAPQQVAYTPPPPVTGAVNERFIGILTAALEKNNQPGFDYFEFRQALANLAKMPMDEKTRFQSAYAMAQTMGASPEKLAESAKFYLQVLNGEQSKFNEAHAQQRSRLIGNREEEIKNHEAMIQQKTEQIKQLTQQIEEHRKSSEQIRNEINDSTVKIETTKADFESTFAVVVGQIQGDVAKIQQYLSH